VQAAATVRNAGIHDAAKSDDVALVRHYLLIDANCVNQLDGWYDSTLILL
jgi:hypothetical protein